MNYEALQIIAWGIFTFCLAVGVSMIILAINLPEIIRSKDGVPNIKTASIDKNMFGPLPENSVYLSSTTYGEPKHDDADGDDFYKKYNATPVNETKQEKVI